MKQRKRTIKELAEFYGISERCCYNWKKAGAPLHDESAMVEWKALYGRVSRHDKLRGELTGNQGSSQFSSIHSQGTQATEQPAEPTEPEGSIDPATDLTPEADKAGGISANVRSLRKAERKFAALFQKAQNSADPKAAFWFAEWGKCSKLLREAERDTTAIQTEQELVVPTAEVTNALGKICSLIRAAVDALPNRVTHKVANLPADSVREAMNKEAEILLRNLHDIPVSLMKLCAKDPLFVKGMTKEEIAAAIREVEAEFSEIKAP
jgi:hypothetical protein